MRILLHIGQSKTGTSAIQAYLTLNRARLREAGALYPAVMVGGMPVDLGNHNAFADALVGLLRFPNLTAEQYVERFFHEAALVKAKNMILSAEHFFGGEPRIWDVKDEETYFDLYRKKIEAIARYLEGHEVRLLVYLRPQVDWLASAISQTVRVEKLITDKAIYFDDSQFFEMAKPVLRYFTLIDTWAEVLRPHEIMVVPYERCFLYKKSAIADFLNRTGLDLPDLPFGDETLQINQSLSWEYVEVKKKLNRRSKTKAEERAVINCLERLSARNNHSLPYRISEELSQKVASFVTPENAKLNACYIKTGAQLRAMSHTCPYPPCEPLGEKIVSEAMDAFETEYARPRTRLLQLQYELRAFLREHAKPVQGTVHQLKRAYRKYAYRK